MEEQDIALIEQYLRGELAAKEAGDVRRRLAEDKAFAELYEDLRYIEKGLQHAELSRALGVIQEAEAAASGAEPGRTALGWRLWLPIAASATLLVVAAWFFLTKATEPEELFAEYFEVYPNVEAPIYRDSSASDSLPTKDLAFRRYADDDFEGAIELFESIAAPDEGTRFYLGMSYLAKGDAGKAIEVFQNLRGEAVDYKTQIDWFLALAFTKQGEIENARKLLEELARSGTAYEERSKAILNTI